MKTIAFIAHVMCNHSVGRPGSSPCVVRLGHKATAIGWFRRYIIYDKGNDLRTIAEHPSPAIFKLTRRRCKLIKRTINPPVSKKPFHITGVGERVCRRSNTGITGTREDEIDVTKPVVM